MATQPTLLRFWEAAEEEKRRRAAENTRASPDWGRDEVSPINWSNPVRGGQGSAACRVWQRAEGDNADINLVLRLRRAVTGQRRRRRRRRSEPNVLNRHMLEGVRAVGLAARQ